MSPGVPIAPPSRRRRTPRPALSSSGKCSQAQANHITSIAGFQGRVVGWYSTAVAPMLCPTEPILGFVTVNLYRGRGQDTPSVGCWVRVQAGALIPVVSMQCFEVLLRNFAAAFVVGEVLFGCPKFKWQGKQSTLSDQPFV